MAEEIKENTAEALARMLFKAKDHLTDFKNHVGKETDTITVNGPIVGFQAKYFEVNFNR